MIKFKINKYKKNYRFINWGLGIGDGGLGMGIGDWLLEIEDWDQ